jgi:ketosteroid isomerase-like protein
VDHGTVVTITVTPPRETGGHVNLNLDVAALQQALDALIAGDHREAADRFTPDVVFTGVGGCLDGHATGLSAVLDRFAEMSRLTDGTFGTEVAGVYGETNAGIVVITRHWASVDGQQVHGTQALLVHVDGDRIGRITALSRPGAPSGIWD